MNLLYCCRFQSGVPKDAKTLLVFVGFCVAAFCVCLKFTKKRDWKVIL